MVPGMGKPLCSSAPHPGCPMLRTMDRCSGNRGFALLRTGVIVVAAAGWLGLATNATSRAGGLPPAAARVLATPERAAESEWATDLIAQGDAAWQAGKLDTADGLYRRAWADAGTRAEASAV